MPSRHDREKADATRTPLADLAPDIPQRDADYVPDVPTPDAPTTNAARIPDDDMLPESSATMPATGPETDTAPANVRARPNARKIATRAAVPAVPRTIAEMQARGDMWMAGSEEADTGMLADTGDDEEEDVPACFVSLPRLIATTLVCYTILAILPALVLFIGRAAALPVTILIAVYVVALMIGSVVTLILLPRYWRAAFHDMPDELRPTRVLDLWQRRRSGARSNVWVTGGLALIGIFLLIFVTTTVGAITALGINALYRIPAQIVVLVSRTLATLLFLGYLYRGFRASFPGGRAALLAGLYFGCAQAVTSGIIYLVLNPTLQYADVVVLGATTLVVALVSAWIRARTRAIYPAVALQLLFLDFRFY